MLPVFKAQAQNNLNQNELTFSAPYLYSFPKTSNISVSKLDTNKFVIAFRNDGYGGKGVSLIGEISEGNVIFGPPEFFDEGVVGEVKVQGLSPTKFVIAWQDEKHGGIGKTIVGEVNYNFISYAESYTFNDKPTEELSITSFNDYDCVIGFSDGGNFGKGTVKRVKVIGNLVTMLNEEVFSDFQPDFNTFIRLSDTTFAIPYYNNSENDVRIRKGSISFDSVFLAEEQIMISNSVDQLVVTGLFGNKFSFSYVNQGCEITKKGVSFSEGFSFGKIDTVLSGNTGNVELTSLDANHYLHIVNYENDSAYVDIVTVNGILQTSAQDQSFEKEISNIVLTALSHERFIIAYSDDANNNSGKLILGSVSYMPGYFFDISAFLEGPFYDTAMNSNSDILPELQPYCFDTPNYCGNEYLSAIPDNIVDWLLIDVRESAGGPLMPTSSNSIFRQAVFISNGGTVLSSDALSIPFAEFSQGENIYVVLYHRNHIDIMSAYPLVDVNGIFEYDFTTSSLNTYGGLNGCSELNSSVFGMTAGDADGDGEIGNADKNEIWLNQLGSTGYLNSDLNIDGNVDFDDKHIFWDLNSGKSSQVPE